MSDLAKWINELAGEYVEDWVGHQIAEGWQKDRDKITELEAELAALREDNQRLVARIAEERSKTLEQIRNKHIAELEAHLAALREAIELCERTRKYNGSGGTCKAHIDSMAVLLGEQR